MDADEAKTIPIGRTRINDSQWIGNDKCVCIADDKSIINYDRPAHNLTPVTTLPFPCFKIGEPSPEGRFLFAAGGLGGRNGVLVDLDKKAAIPVQGGAGITWVSEDTFAFSRDVLDSDLRGTWLQQAGGREGLVSPEPYLPTTNGLLVFNLPSKSLVIFVTQHNLITIQGASLTACKSFEKRRPIAKMLPVLRFE